MPHNVCNSSLPRTVVSPFAAQFLDIFQRGFLYAGHEAPVLRLPERYSAWENALAQAESLRPKMFDQSEAATAWRRSVAEVGVQNLWLKAIVQKIK